MRLRVLRKGKASDISLAVLKLRWRTFGQVERQGEEKRTEEDQNDAGGDQPAQTTEVAENADDEANQHQRDVGAGAVWEQRGEG